jgi:hypothetical protein
MIATEEELVRWVETGRVEYAAVRDLLSLSAQSRLQSLGFAGPIPALPVTSTEVSKLLKAPKPIKFGKCKSGFGITFEVPIKLVSEANTHDGLKAQLRRKAQVKRTMRQVLTLIPRVVALPCTVTMVRFGPKELDSDNLDNAFKAVRDMIAEWVGVDDADKRYTWQFHQKPGKAYKVRVTIWCGA